MAQKPDPLDKGVSLSVQLHNYGVTVASSSRAITALDRLFGAVIGVPAAGVEKLYERLQAQNNQEKALREAEQDAAIAKLQNDAAFGDRVIDNFLLQEARKQHNKEEVGYKAIEYLEAESDSDDDAEDKYLGEDWLNFFEGYAQHASSEELRDLWGKLLAGEIRKPGTFSLSTIRFIAELDKEIAEKFQEVATYMLPDGAVLRPKNLRGQDLLDYTFLEEVGLLQEVNGNLSLATSKDKEGYQLCVINEYLLQCDSNKDVIIPVIRVTRVGREVSIILPKESSFNISKKIADYIADQCSHIYIHRIIRQYSDGTIEHEQVDKPV